MEPVPFFNVKLRFKAEAEPCDKNSPQTARTNRDSLFIIIFSLVSVNSELSDLIHEPGLSEAFQVVTG